MQGKRKADDIDSNKGFSYSKDIPQFGLLSSTSPLPVGITTSVEEARNSGYASKRVKLSSGKVPMIRFDSLTEKSLGPFETFSKQRLALQRIRELGERSQFRNLRVFSEEVEGGEGGSRKYIATTVDRFWHWYSKYSLRHLYELIADGSPCRLYFDLEYNKDTNPDVDSRRSYDHFIATTCVTLKEMFELEVSENNFLSLDSSTPQKFSCHLICHLPGGKLFPSSTSIRQVADQLKTKLLIDPPYRIMSSDGSRETVLFDDAVYTKNRTFRLFLSSKLGKDTVLQRASFCKFYDGKPSPSEKRIFLDSLCVPVGAEDVKPEQLLICSEDSSSSNGIATSGGALCSSRVGNGELNSHGGVGLSPFPYLDEFVLMMLRRWKPNAYIRQWKMTRDVNNIPVAVTYYPANCRYCFNMGRAHKSNGVFWTVNLVKLEMFQRCFDPDCRGFRSNSFSIPVPIKEGIQKEIARDSELNAPIPADVSELLDKSRHELDNYFDQWEGVFEA